MSSTEGRGRQRVRWGALLVALVLIASYRFITSPILQESMSVALLAAAAAALGWRAARGTVDSRVWAMWAAGLALVSLGMGARLLARGLHGDVPAMPHLADAFFVTATLALVGGFILALPGGRDRDQVIDQITVIAATGGAIILLLVPWGTLRVTPSAGGTVGLYPLLAMLVGAAVLRLVRVAHRRTPALVAVVAGSLVLMATQSAYAVLVLLDLYDTGHAIDTGWHLAALLWAAASLHPSSTKVLAPLSPAAPQPLTAPRVAFLAYSVLVLPVIRLGQQLVNDVESVTVFPVAVASVGLLILLRVLLIARRLQALAQEQHVLLTDQQQLRVSYDLSLQAAQTHTWEWDVGEGTLRFSDHARKLYGEPPQRMRDWLALVHPDDLPLAARAVEAGSPEEPTQAFEVRVRGGDGEWRRVACTGRGFFDDGELVRSIGVGVDVTAVREAEQEAARRAALLEHVTEASQVVLFRSRHPRFAITFMSENVERIMGHPRELWHDPVRVRELIHPDDLALLRPLAADLDRQGHGEIEVRLRHSDGDWRSVQVRVQLDEALLDGPPGLVGSALDVTEQRAAEEQLRHAQKLEAVGRVAGGVAHDFNNLLTAMLGYVELARTAEDEAARADHLAEVTSAGERAASLVDQLLAFSRRRANRPEPTEVNDAVASVVRLAERIIADGVHVSTALSEGLPPVLVDPVQLEQAILNLILNARDAVALQGHIVVSTAIVAPEEMAGLGLESAPAGSCVAVSVSDDGHGMSRDVREHAVEPFFTTKPEGAGTGLGLSSAYGFANQADGALVIDSDEHVGTTVTILLPPANHVDEVPPAPPAPPAVLTGSGRVLVVEDQPQVRALLQRALESNGYEVVIAVDGTEGLATVEAGFRPDLVVSDIVMPGIDGVALARRLRSMDDRIGVLLISGYSEGRLGDATQDQGIRFLQKPFTLEQLLANVDALASSRQPPATS